MDYVIKRNGKKITLTEDELDNLLIMREFNNFKSNFDKDDVFILYMFLALESTDINNEILDQAKIVCGEEKKVEGNAFDNVDFDALEEDE